MSSILNIAKLLLPAFIPSWNFFDVIAPSPRIQYALFSSSNKLMSEWTEFRPRPNKLSFMDNLFHLFWNPAWNENLFMMSCAERILAQGNDCNNLIVQHSELEIFSRIEKYLNTSKQKKEFKKVNILQFRLEINQRNKTNGEVEKSIWFYSAKRTINIK